VVKHVTEVRWPLLLTSRGRGVAVVQSVSDYEKAEKERPFMRAVGGPRIDGPGGQGTKFLWARPECGCVPWGWYAAEWGTSEPASIADVNYE